MTQKQYSKKWGICVAIVVASAWLFDHTQNVVLQTVIGSAALIATGVCVMNHFRMYAQIQKEIETENEILDYQI
jgi:hypothetical protein